VVYVKKKGNSKMVCTGKKGKGKRVYVLTYILVVT